MLSFDNSCLLVADENCAAGGKLAFVAQDDSYNTEISISFNNGKHLNLLPLAQLRPPLPHPLFQ
jgi:hypothetical protein